MVRLRYSLVFVLVCASPLAMDLVYAQAPSPQAGNRTPYGSNRYTNEWRLSAPQNQNSRPSQDSSAVVQSAFYQAPGTGMGLPAYPNGGGDAPANYSNDVGLPPPLPSGMPNALSNTMSNNQVGNPRSMVTPGRLSDVEVPNAMPPQNTMPPQNYSASNQPFAAPQQPAFDPYAREQQQVLPPDQMSSPYRTASTDLRAVPSNQPSPATNNPANDLRPVRPTMQRGFGPSAQQIEVATGYPFVSPAPRTGNYPTSQYNSALFRPISYQNVVQSPQAPLSAAVGNTQPTLPQFQAQPVGVYPTQYQCAPGTATYPPAGAVPGAYVPPTLPPNLTPGTYSPNNSGYVPFFSLGQENYNVQIGRGIIGQPTVYVPGQPFRNFLRYLSP